MLLQDHRTMSTESVCISQCMVRDQHWATGMQMEHSTLSDRIGERRLEQNGLQFSTEDGKRRRFRARCGRAFHAHAAATGNGRSPRFEWCVDGTSRVGGSEVLTCATARDWTDGLSKVVRRSATEVGSHNEWKLTVNFEHCVSSGRIISCCMYMYIHKECM